MAAEVPAIEPDTVVAGDTIEFKVLLPDYLPGDGWVLSYHILNASGDLGQFDATDNGDGYHLVTISAATSALWDAGDDYTYLAFVAKSGLRYQVRSGSLRVLPNYATADSHDGRSWAQRTLSAVEAVLASKATKDQLSYSIAGRSLARYSFKELIEVRDTLRAEVRAEKDAERREKGLAPRTKVLTTFVRR